jgi:hypothetical protein
LILAAATTLAFTWALRTLIDQGLVDHAAPDVLATKFFELFMVAVALAIFSAARFYTVSWLGEKITVMTKARLLVDGEVRGDINGKEVIVGQSGRVTGTVAAHAIEVHGHVYGAVKAGSVTLHPTAVVEGDIYNQTLRISEGAIFDGRVRRAKTAAELEPILDPAQLVSLPTG